MHDGPNVPSSRVEHEHEEEVPHDHGGSKLKGPTPEDVKVMKSGLGHTSVPHTYHTTPSRAGNQPRDPVASPRSEAEAISAYPEGGGGRRGGVPGRGHHDLHGEGALGVATGE